MIKKINTILIALGLFFSPIIAKAETVYATSSDGKMSYTSIDAAWNAAQNGEPIVMQCDWNISSRLVLDEGKKATVEMNGHKISRNLTSSKTNGEVIILKENSKLNLNGALASYTNFTFKGYDGFDSEDYKDVTIQSGGLITGGYSSNGAGGIHMKAGSTLNLYFVSIAGNNSVKSLGSDGYGGAIYMDGDNDTVDMTATKICYNIAEVNGGGIYADDEYATIKMCDSTISNNYAYYGGGLYSDDLHTKVTMDNSSFAYNVSKSSGGAMYFFHTDFEVVSDKCNSYITGNKNKYISNAAAIRCNSVVFTTNKGKISGLTFNDNVATEGQIIKIAQENIVISNCTFTNNTCESGVINVDNDNFTLENSTIENNTIEDEDYGAVYIDSLDDINLKGKVIIQNNHNLESNTDTDLCLQTGIASDAYILSAPDASSRVGLVITGNRVMAKNQNSDMQNVYFLNGNPFGKNEIVYDDSAKTISIKEGTSGVIVAEASNQDNLLDETIPTEGALVEATETAETTEDPEIETRTVTLNKTNESGTWTETETLSFNANETFSLLAPAIDNRTFVEWRYVPEGLTVDNDVITSNNLTEDIELTVVYTDSDNDMPLAEEIHIVTINLVDEEGNVLDTQQMEFYSIDVFELQAPSVEGKAFVEWQNVPENINVDGETLKADSLTEDLELIAVYSEAQVEESSETGSIFGNGNTTVALIVVILLAAIGGTTYYKKKKIQ